MYPLEVAGRQWAARPASSKSPPEPVAIVHLDWSPGGHSENGNACRSGSMLLLCSMMFAPGPHLMFALKNVPAVKPPRSQAVELGIKHHHRVDGSVTEEPSHRLVVPGIGLQVEKRGDVAIEMGIDL